MVYDHIMSLAGLILTALGTLAAIVQTYYARVQVLRDRATQEMYGHRTRHGRGLHRQWLGINIIGTCLALCVLSVGIFLIVNSTGSPTVPHPNQTQAQSTVRATPSQENGQPISTPSTVGTSTWSRQWGPRDLLFSNGVYSDLDSVPPNVNADNIGIGFTVYSNQFQFNEMVSWTRNGTGTATPAACDNLLATQGVQSLKPVVKNTYCVKTNQGNIAIIVVKRIDVDPNASPIDNMSDVLVRATIWTNNS